MLKTKKCIVIIVCSNWIVSLSCAPMFCFFCSMDSVHVEHSKNGNGNVFWTYSLFRQVKIHILMVCVMENIRNILFYIGKILLIHFYILGLLIKERLSSLLSAGITWVGSWVYREYWESILAGELLSTPQIIHYWHFLW